MCFEDGQGLIPVLPRDDCLKAFIILACVAAKVGVEFELLDLKRKFGAAVLVLAYPDCAYLKFVAGRRLAEDAVAWCSRIGGGDRDNVDLDVCCQG